MLVQIDLANLHDIRSLGSFAAASIILLGILQSIVYVIW